MADAKTTTHYLRLVKGFGAASHRRAGVELSAGPTPVEVELTKDQLDAINSDPGIEVVDKKEATKLIKAGGKYTAEQEGSTDEQQDPDNVDGERPTESTAPAHANPGPDPFPGADESGLTPVPKAGESVEDAGSESDQLSSLTNAQLKQIAADEGTAVDNKDNKATLIEKIEAGRQNTANADQKADQSAENAPEEAPNAADLPLNPDADQPTEE